MSKNNNLIKVEIDGQELKTLVKNLLTQLKNWTVQRFNKSKAKLTYFKRLNEIQEDRTRIIQLYALLGGFMLIELGLLVNLKIVLFLTLPIILMIVVDVVYRRNLPKLYFKKIQEIYREQVDSSFKLLTVEEIYVDLVFTMLRLESFEEGKRYYSLNTQNFNKCHDYLRGKTDISKNEQLERLEVFRQNNDISPKVHKVLRNILENKNSLGFIYHEENQLFTNENVNSCEIKCRLFEGKTIKSVRDSLHILQQKTSFKNMKIIEDSIDARYFTLKVIFNTNIKVNEISVKDRISHAENGKILMGNTENGSAEITADSLNKTVSHWLISALSGSGKSVLVLNLLTSLLNLKFKGKYMYEDCLIVSLKSQDYLEARLDERGIVVRDSVEDMEKMVDYVSTINTQRINILKKHRLDNANNLNKQIEVKNIIESYMGNILLVLDEFQNLLEGTDNETKKRILGKVAILLRTSRSQNINIMVIQQSAKKEDLKNIRQNVNIMILGRQIDNFELASLDSSGEITKYYKDLDSRGKGAQGKFFINSEIKINGNGSDYASSFSILHTSNISKQEIATDFTRKFNTNNKYLEDVEQIINGGEKDIF
ncbi:MULTISPECIES: hypothetical protein [Vagococcus]|uniref:FtsK domain-containing protein n=1 Tax=Vagococcus fluvialis bH819 TaxID=1255619 RepID=A0A1X6WQ45_9ENTE|nr:MULTISPECIES: hypothetical protein [Vagococcus]SLM86362.1 hypothetical protein FM121_09745 [Vagococcus fluvialis bH819]HCM89016.1 hypothetical protein [Vagococcus sp.]